MSSEPEVATVPGSAAHWPAGQNRADIKKGPASHDRAALDRTMQDKLRFTPRKRANPNIAQRTAT